MSMGSIVNATNPCGPYRRGNYTEVKALICSSNKTGDGHHDGCVYAYVLKGVAAWMLMGLWYLPLKHFVKFALGECTEIVTALELSYL